MRNGPAVEGEGIDVISKGTEGRSGIFFAAETELKPGITDEEDGPFEATPKETSWTEEVIGKLADLCRKSAATMSSFAWPAIWMLRSEVRTQPSQTGHSVIPSIAIERDFGLPLNLREEF